MKSSLSHEDHTYAEPQDAACVQAKQDWELGPIFEEEPYPQYPPGLYEVRCVGAKIYRDPRFRAFKCKVDFEILWPKDSPFPSEEVRRVVGFFHLGDGKKPHAGRGSKYYHAWVIANGAPPTKRQRLSPAVFRDKNFLVRIGDVVRRADGREHHSAETYSTVQEIVEKRVG